MSVARTDRLQQLRAQFPLIEETAVFDDGSAGAEHWKARQMQWQDYANEHDLQPVEFLVPRIACHCPADEPPFIVNGVENTAYTRAQLEQTLEQLGPWGFYFRLRDGLTTELAEEIREGRDSPRLTRNRTLTRSHMITNTVEKLLGANINNSTVLDMGSNCGFFSFDIASRGAKQVTGIELRDENLARAHFLKDYYRQTNVNFVQGDVLDDRVLANLPQQTFDVVYNLGLLYHVVDPIALVERTYDLCNNFAVIDTVCRKEPVSAFFAVYDKKIQRLGAGKQRVEFHRTYRALLDAMHFAGFRDIVELVPTSGKISGMYAQHQRRCLIGFK